MKEGEWVIVVMFVWLWTLLSVEPTIHPYSVEHANEVCASNGGWKKIEEGYLVWSSVECNNGAEFHYDWTELDAKNKRGE